MKSLRGPWKRIWLDDLKDKNIGGDIKYGEIVRIYVPEGRQWPRLVLKIHHGWEGKPFEQETFRVSCSMKRHKNDWWDDSELLLQFASELAEMLTEYKKSHEE